MRLLMLLLLFPTLLQAETWVHDTFEDFSRGTLDASGQNLYVSRGGNVRTIHRFDLNQDGHLDLLFNNTHDTRGILPATLATVSPDRRIAHQQLPVAGSQRVLLEDLNKDGHLDAVFCPNPQGVQHARRFLTIFWGGTDGWNPARANGLLPTHGATGIEVLDLDLDSWPDIAVLNAGAWLPGQPQGRIVRVYWGGEHGFLLHEFNDYSGGSAIDMAAGDLSSDGRPDLVLVSGSDLHVLSAQPKPRTELGRPQTIPLGGADATCIAALDATSSFAFVAGSSAAKIYAISPRGAVTTYPALPAAHVAAGDIDGDGHPDIVLTDNSITRAAGGEQAAATGGAVRVIWGSTEGWSMEHCVPLQVPNAMAAAIGDVDGDALKDIVVAVYQGTDSFSADSRVFFYKGRRQLAPAPQGIPTSGAVDAAVAPAEGAHPARIIFTNSTGGVLNERVPLYLYWGAKDGFHPENVTQIPFVSGYEASAADLNEDGFADLIALCSGHMGAAAEELVELGANIYWGGPRGFDGRDRRTVLREQKLFNSNVADLDKDGHLDLVLGVYDPSVPGEKDPLILYYGSSGGFSTARRQVLPSEGRSAICTVADFNKDSWLDIAVTSYNKNMVRIFWGGAAGFSEGKQQQLMMPTPIEMDTADLNADGWLDLIVGSYSDPIADHHDTGLLVFWGAPEGFRESNAQWLPGYTPLGITIADWDADGHLDLFFASYHGEITRESLPSYLYWGSSTGYTFENKTILFNDSAADGFAGDFNSDGRLDLAVSNHTTDGNHAAMSKVYYNDGQRFKKPEITELATIGPHWFWTEDMGHLYTRRFEQTYESPVISWTTEAGVAKLHHEASTPEGTTLNWETRAGASQTNLAVTPWQPLTRRIQLQPEDRCLQYRATFHSDNGDRYATLDRVIVEVE